MKVLEGKLVAGKGKFAIVGARFNEFIVSKLISGAEDTLVRHGVDTDDITLVWVPGAFEIPLAAQKLAQSGKYDAVICLGAVIAAGDCARRARKGTPLACLFHYFLAVSFLFLFACSFI